MSGATADAANRPRALSRLVASAPRARKIGLASMIRVSSIVRSRRPWSKPGVIAGTSTGAASQTTTASTSSSAIIRFATVEATRQARPSSPPAWSPARTGMSAELRAPAATSWKMKSGIRNAA